MSVTSRRIHPWEASIFNLRKTSEINPIIDLILGYDDDVPAARNASGKARSSRTFLFERNRCD